MHGGVQGRPTSRDKDQTAGDVQDRRDRIHHAQPGKSASGPAREHVNFLGPHFRNWTLMCSFQVLGVSRKSSCVTVFTLKDGFIRSAVAEETHTLAVNARRSAAINVASR